MYFKSHLSKESGLFKQEKEQKNVIEKIFENKEQKKLLWYERLDFSSAFEDLWKDMSSEDKFQAKNDFQREMLEKYKKIREGIWTK